MFAEDVILRPIITEKTMDDMDDNKYTFEVSVRANKTHVRQAVEKLFNVTVTNVNILNVHPKVKRVGRYAGMTRKRRKAVVTLAEGDSIDIFPAEQTEE